MRTSISRYRSQLMRDLEACQHLQRVALQTASKEDTEAAQMPDSAARVLKVLQERTVVPLTALESTAKYGQPLVQLPDYIADGINSCMAEASRSVKSVRKSSALLTDRLKKASRTAGRGGEHVLLEGNEFQSPWDKARIRRPKKATFKDRRREMLRFGPLDMEDEESKQVIDQLFEDQHSAPDAKGRRIEYNPHEVLGYAAARLPGCYAVASRILEELANRLPDFKPTSMLDFGAGPGTAIWAAKDAWVGSIEVAHAVETSSAMKWLGSRIEQQAVEERTSGESHGMDQGEHENQDQDSGSEKRKRQHSIRWLSALHGFLSEEQLQNKKSSKQWLRKQSPGPSTGGRVYDLVIASYSFGELDPLEQRRALDALWEATGKMLIIIEPGTPSASALVRAARQQILDWEKQEDGGVEAHVVAPCPHDGRCPMDGKPTWCHFSQRVERQALNRLVKVRRGKMPNRTYQDERYSYVALMRGPRAARAADVILPDQMGIVKDHLGSGPPMDGLAVSTEPSDYDEHTGQADSPLSSSEEEGEAHLGIETEFEPETEPQLSDDQRRVLAEASHRWSRIIRPPRKRSRHRVIDVCAHSGELLQQTLGSAERKGFLGLGAHKVARSLGWGDLLPAIIEEQCKGRS